jgi:hypothetical protein
MFSRFVRPFWKRIFTPRKILTTTAILTYSLFKANTLLNSSINNDKDDDNEEKENSIQVDL